jgi:trigger factor
MVGRAEVRIAGRDGVFFETDQALVVVPAKEDEGKGQVLGLMIDGLDAILLGKKPGDTVVIQTTGPEQHEREEVRGAKLTITYTINAAERITPASVADLVERFSLQSEDILREQIRFALEQRRDAEQRNAQREQVFEWLLSKVQFELPAKLSERQVTRTLSRQRMEMLYRGLEPDVVERRLAELRGSSEQSTRDRLRLFFVMARLAEQFGVTVTEQELSGRIHMLAQQQNVRPDQLRAQLSKSGGLDDLAIQIREHKTADRLLEKASVTEVPAEEWNAQVQAKTAEKIKSRAAGSAR